MKHSVSHPIKLVGLSLIVSLAFLAGCQDKSEEQAAAPSEPERTAEEIITEKAEARWGIRIEGRTYGLFDYLNPAQQKLFEREAYEQSFGRSLNYTDAEVSKIECNEEETRCEVQVMVGYQRKEMQNRRPLDEVWVKQEGDWWIYAD